MMPWTPEFVSVPPSWVGAEASLSPSPPQEEVMQAPPAMQPPQGSLALLWQPSPYIDLTGDDDEEDGGA